METNKNKEWLELNKELDVTHLIIRCTKENYGFIGYACDEPKDLVSKLKPLRDKVKSIHNQMLNLSGMNPDKEMPILDFLQKVKKETLKEEGY